MESMVIKSMVTETMEHTENNKKPRKKHCSAILKGIAVVLALFTLFLIFVCPEFPLKFFDMEEDLNSFSSNADQGNEKAILKVNEERKTYDGNGIFDPMRSVEAYDINGEEILDKVAVTYISGPSIAEKHILYTVFDSDSRRLEASCLLIMENYDGPSIQIGDVRSITWEELQNLTELLIKEDQLAADDGFGNKCPNQVTYYYEIDPVMQTAEITFSLRNEFQDYTTKKILVSVEGLPEAYMESGNENSYA